MTDEKMVTVTMTEREANIIIGLVLSRRWDVEDGGAQYKELTEICNKILPFVK